MPPKKIPATYSAKKPEERPASARGRGRQTVQRTQSPRALVERSGRGTAKDKDSEHKTEVANRRENAYQNYRSKEVTASSTSVNDEDKRTTLQCKISNSSDRKDDRKTAAISNTQTDDTNSTSEPKVYKDNALNRRLGRVGKPLGTAVYSMKTKSISEKTYKNNALNRKLIRVGLPLGSMSVQKKSSITRRIPEILEGLKQDTLENFTIDYSCTASQSGDECAVTQPKDSSDEAFEQAICQYNRKEAEASWQRQSEIPDSRPKTVQLLLEDYEGKMIPFSDLKLHKLIGRGGSGEVFLAKWCESVVAVKKLREANLYDKKLQAFAKEVMKFCKLNHPNIVKFIGACTEIPNICIVMEYMQMSLYDAIHLRNDIDFSDTEKTDIVKQTSDGVKYLHASRIAHCDLKTLNVLLDYVEDKICEVKITDFGLSMVKTHTLEHGSLVEVVRNAGTPRYSAPEVLRGEMLSAREMMKADVYSLSLVVIEVLFDQEPFPEYNRQQLRELVGTKGEGPEISKEAPKINKKAWSILQRAWSFKSVDRPDIADVCGVFRQVKNIYTEELEQNVVESLSSLRI